MEHVNDELGKFPIWLCPCVDVYHDKPTLLSGKKTNLQGANGILGKETSNRAELMLNVGIYGPAIPDTNEFLAANRQPERLAKDLGGQKAFCGCAYYTEAEFWTIYDLEWYNGLRAKYGASSAVSVYDKMVNHEQLNLLEVERLGIHIQV